MVFLTIAAAGTSVAVLVKWGLLCTRRHYLENLVSVNLLDDIVQPAKAMNVAAYDESAGVTRSLYDVKIDLVRDPLVRRDDRQKRRS